MAQNLKKAAQKMKKKGRFGDSELVHVNPAEKKMLENMSGGITSKNPDTGLDEHFWSILVPAAIGAITGAARGGGVKGALKGALLGGATAGLGAGIGGLASGEGFMTGLGTMFGGAGQGVNGLGSLFGLGDAAKSGASAGIGPGYSGPIGPLNPATNFGNVAMGAKSLSAAAPVGAVEQTLTGGIGDFLKTPQGLVTASGILGALTDDGEDPYADDIAKKRAKEQNYVRYSGGMADNRFAKGGSVHMESDATYQPRPDPKAQQRLADAVRQVEQKVGRRLDEDEVQDLMGRMNSGVGTAVPQYASGGPVAGIGGGKDDKIKALLSDGEHVITADEVSMLGDGSNDAGHKKLYSMRKKLRKHKTGKTKHMPMAKSPEAYAGIGA